jgi:anthranilate/para-aminobenzoate synthase component II
MRNLGYCEHGPYDGIGPFRQIFPGGGVPLRYKDSLDGLDAIVLWGGEDISPSLYGEEPFPHSGPKNPTARDLFEWEVMRQAHLAQIPLIGVCRGAQIMCAFAGGKLIQNVNGHGQNHEITTSDGEVMVATSSHHQMLWPYDVEHELLAWSTQPRSKVYQPETTYHSDAMSQRHYAEPEVVFFPEIKGLAIQPHPEWKGNDERFLKWVFETIEKFLFAKECC